MLANELKHTCVGLNNGKSNFSAIKFIQRSASHPSRDLNKPITR